MNRDEFDYGFEPEEERQAAGSRQGTQATPLYLPSVRPQTRETARGAIRPFTEIRGMNLVLTGISTETMRMRI